MLVPDSLKIKDRNQRFSFLSADRSKTISYLKYAFVVAMLLPYEGMIDELFF